MFDKGSAPLNSVYLRYDPLPPGNRKSNLFDFSAESIKISVSTVKFILLPSGRGGGEGG